jgi:hypothetical protein
MQVHAEVSIDFSDIIANDIIANFILSDRTSSIESFPDFLQVFSAGITKPE